ncbi:MAG: hypothetical protein B7733_14865 [Myxococcales bacterium FL481]|nr:MAG: hypothetical protein B7733_14865 [Myxococcales bacterium FL481]
MYLRTNKTKSGGKVHVYRSIAHNVWCGASTQRKSKTRPVVIARLGAAADVDECIARELVIALESCFGLQLQPVRGGGRWAELEQIAGQVRPLEGFLRVLVNPRLGLARYLPDNGNRVTLLEDLVRDRLADPAGGEVEATLWESLRAGDDA